MPDLNADIGVPRIPRLTSRIEKIEPPKGENRRASKAVCFQHSWELLFYLIGTGIRNLPAIIKRIIIPLAIVTAMNIALETLPTYTLYGFPKAIVMFLVFITSSYNSIIPRTIFWIIILTIGKTLFRRIRSEGLGKVVSDFKTFPGNLMEARKSLGMTGNYVLVAAAGIGFMAANYLTRNNRIDKAAVTYVIAIALVNTLSKGSKTMLFIALKLAYKDLTGFIKKAGSLKDNQVFIIISGFIAGLILNSVFTVIKLDFGGYILGLVLFAAGLLMGFIRKKGVDTNQSENLSG